MAAAITIDIDQKATWRSSYQNDCLSCNERTAFCSLKCCFKYVQSTGEADGVPADILTTVLRVLQLYNVPDDGKSRRS